jgi:hypothetical protein
VINCLLATQVEGQVVSLASGGVKRLGEAATDFVAEFLESLHLRGRHLAVGIQSSVEQQIHAVADGHIVDFLSTA